MRTIIFVSAPKCVSDGHSRSNRHAQTLQTRIIVDAMHISYVKH